MAANFIAKMRHRHAEQLVDGSGSAGTFGYGNGAPLWSERGPMAKDDRFHDEA